MVNVRLLEPRELVKRDVPVAATKFNVVTVLDPALKFPVRAKEVPVASLKVMSWRARVVALMKPSPN